MPVSFIKEERCQTLRNEVVKWLLEIIVKRKKTLATFDKTVRLFDRVNHDLSNKNVQSVLLACFDLVQRLNEVTYVNSLEIISWIHQPRIDQQRFNKTKHEVYIKANTMVNSPTAQTYLCSALGVMRLSHADTMTAIIVEVGQFFCAGLKLDYRFSSLTCYMQAYVALLSSISLLSVIHKVN